MKRVIILLVSVIFLSVFVLAQGIPPAPDPEPYPVKIVKCIDSDGGTNFYERGVIDYEIIEWNAPATHIPPEGGQTDSCIEAPKGHAYYLKTTQVFLREGYCESPDGIDVKYKDYDCSSEGKVCYEGACVVNEDQECTSYNVACASGSTPESYLDNNCEQWRCVPIDQDCPVVVPLQCDEGQYLYSFTNDDGCPDYICAQCEVVVPLQCDEGQNLVPYTTLRGCTDYKCVLDGVDCPQYTPSSPNFCEEGTLTEIGTDENNCPRPPKCNFDLSNGRTSEIKIIPEVASEKAIEVLGELNFTIELKEVGKVENVRAAYEVKAEKQGRFLGIFKIRGEVSAIIDAETGEIISIGKPWWAFLASGI